MVQNAPANIIWVKIMRKIVLIILCALTVLSAVGCSELGEYTVNERTVMTVGEIDVSYDMYKFIYNMTIEEMTDADWSSAEELEKLKLKVEDTVKLYCAQMLLFDKYEIGLTSADKEAIDAEIQYYIDEQGGEEKYRNWLSENHISGKYFRSQLERLYYLDPYLREVLFTGIDNMIKMDDNTVYNDVKENFYRYTQIYVAVGENDNYLTKRLDIDAAYAELEKGKSFEDVALKYSDWTVNTARGVYTTAGEKLIQIEEEALSLELGEYGEVIESSEGFHIIKRLELEDEYIWDNLDDLGYISATRRYNELLKSEADKLTAEYNMYYETLTHEQLISVEYP